MLSAAEALQERPQSDEEGEGDIWAHQGFVPSTPGGPSSSEASGACSICQTSSIS